MRLVLLSTVGIATFVTDLRAWPDPKMGELLKTLQSPIKAERLKAMKDVGNRGAAGNEAVPLLAKNLRHQDRELADQAAQALSQIGPASVAELTGALADEATAVRKRALKALGVIGPEAAAAAHAVAQFLLDKDAKVRLLAGQVLAEMGPKAHQAAPFLAKALQDTDPQVRWQAAQALHELGLEMVSHVLPVLRDPDLSVRLNAVQSLGMFYQSRDAVQGLVEALHDRETEIRAAAASTLVRLGPAAKIAWPALLKSLQEPSQELQAKALAAIQAIGTAQDVCLCEAVSAVNDDVRWAGRYSLKQFGVNSRDGVKPLLGLLNHANPTMRLGAALALARLGPEAKSGVPVLTKLTGDPSRCVRAAILLALPAIDRKHKADMAKVESLILRAIEDLKVDKEPDLEEIIQLHILLSSASNFGLLEKGPNGQLKGSLQTACKWVRRRLDDVPSNPWSMAAFVRGLNVTGKLQLGFTEPFCTLSFRFQALAQTSKELQQLIYAFGQLEDGIPRNSPYSPLIQQNRLQVLSNPTFLDHAILVKNQSLRGKAVALFSTVDYQSFAGLVRGCTGHRGRLNVLGSHQEKIAKEQTELRFLWLVRTQDIFAALWKVPDVELVKKLRDPDALVRWVAINMIERRRAHLEKDLIGLLNDPVIDVREAARRALGRIARGTDFGPRPLASGAEIQRAIQRWNDWLDLQQAVSTANPTESLNPLPKDKKKD